MRNETFDDDLPEEEGFPPTERRSIDRSEVDEMTSIRQPHPVIRSRITEQPPDPTSPAEKKQGQEAVRVEGNSDRIGVLIHGGCSL